MIEIVKVVKVEPLGGHRLRLRFSDGAEGERDFSEIVGEGGPFLELGTLTWPNGFDLDSIALHDEMQQAGLLHRTAA